MKLINFAVVFLLLFTSSYAQNAKTAKNEINTLINSFSSAVDSRNSEALEPLLNENFRVIANRFPTDDKTTVLTKETYITFLKAGKIGGEKRKLKIKWIDVTNHIASAKIVFESDKTVFTTYQSFILNPNNVWQLISDMPFLKKNQK